MEYLFLSGTLNQGPVPGSAGPFLSFLRRINATLHQTCAKEGCQTLSSLNLCHMRTRLMILCGRRCHFFAFYSGQPRYKCKETRDQGENLVGSLAIQCAYMLSRTRCRRRMGVRYILKSMSNRRVPSTAPLFIMTQSVAYEAPSTTARDSSW